MPPIKLWRSLLSVPAINRRALEKSRTLAADIIIYDLEDAVAPGKKAEARENLERLYSESVSQAENFRRGNVQLKKAVERSAGSSNYLVVLILVVALALLFLDRMT